MIFSSLLQNEKDEGLKVGKNRQAQAQLTVRNRETGVKKAEKALEDKVRAAELLQTKNLLTCPRNPSCLQLIHR